MKNKGKTCKIANCQRDAACKGLCWKHYQQMRLRGKIIEKNYVYIDGICKNIGCGNKLFAKGLCQKHYLTEKKENDSK